MVWIGCTAKIIKVATYTVVPQPVETQLRFAHMAFIATDGRMYAGERESILLVECRDVVYQPVIGGMATGAIIPDCLLVNVGMAGDTIGFRF